jgi:putative ABC transport system substrate-binding protein
MMRRREFIAGLSGAAAWPLAARAQQGGRLRRIGALIYAEESDPIVRAGWTAFRQAQQQLGWAEDRNMRIDIRYETDRDALRSIAAELVSLAPDLIVAYTAPSATALVQQTQTIPIVLIAGGDVFGGLISNISHPERNLTGVDNFDRSIRGKWLALLKEAVPSITRVGITVNPGARSDRVSPTGLTQPIAGEKEIDEAARALGVRVVAIPYRDTVDLVRAIDGFAGEPNSGLLIPTPLGIPFTDRRTIKRLAMLHRLPISGAREAAAEGGLIGYGPNTVDLFQRAGFYVDRILRGTRPGDLPVEFPTRYELVINLKTAKAIGVEIPPTLLALANEIIE